LNLGHTGTERVDEMTKDLNAGVFQQNVVLSLDDVGLAGELNIPENASSVIMFVDGNGSSRLSALNRFVASELNKVGHATLTFDLMTSDEETDEESNNRKFFGFHTEFLSHRVMEANKWLRSNGDTEKLPIGFFCTGDGAEAALVAASQLKRKVKAIVIAGGWINLTDAVLEQITPPTLFITRDDQVEELLQIRATANKLRCEHHVETISLSGNEDYADCDQSRMAELARQWFSWFLSRE